MSYNANLENFFKSHTIIDVISDYEGEEINSKLYDDKKGLIICGDMLDSTVGGGSDKSFDNLTGTIAENIQKISSLNNILSVVTNKHIHLVFGNRDVNKFKCKFLTKMLSYEKSPKTDIYYDFNKGNINLSYESYENLKKMPIIWLADTKHWYPFWNNAAVSGARKDYWLKEEKKLLPEDILKNDGIFFRRFQRIFGVDGPNTIGTMSAQNLLYTIPLELGIKLDNTKITDKIYLDYLAFIVLATFRVMTLIINVPPKIEKQDIKSIGTQNILNKTILNGLLSKFYGNLPNTSFVSYFNDESNKKLYLFSHGGITSTLIKGINMIGLNKIIEDNYKSLINDSINDSINMSGGNLELSSTDIMDKLDTVNKTYIDIMINSFRKPKTKPYDYKPTKEMLLALSLSAPYKPNSNDIFILNSPITPGIDEIQKYLFYCSDKDIVQIFGHVPKGFSSNISTNVNNNKKIYLINLDYSQSYKYTTFGGKTNSVLIFETSNLKLGPILNSTIDLTLLIKNKLSTFDINPSDKNTNKFISNQKIYGNILKTSTNIFDPEFINYEKYIPKIKENKNFPDYKYHGLYSDDNKQQFYVFSTLNSFFKILVIKRKIEEKSAKDKYYKYKLKYIKLKMSLNEQK